jgi:hypothetical protein
VSNAALGYLVLGLVLAVGLALVLAVAWRKPPRPPGIGPGHNRIRGRSLRGWQASVNRDIRRRGR